MYGAPTFKLTSNTFQIQETLSIEAFSSLLEKNEPITRHIPGPTADLCTFQWIVFPNGIDSLWKRHVSVILKTNFTPKMENIAYIRRKFSIIDPNGEKCNTKGK